MISSMASRGSESAAAIVSTPTGGKATTIVNDETCADVTCTKVTTTDGTETQRTVTTYTDANRVTATDGENVDFIPVSDWE